MTQVQGEEKKRAVLVGACQQDDAKFQTAMKELEGLATACRMEVCAVITQNLAVPNKATYIGSGKVAQVREAVFLHQADCAVFLNALTPSQLTNLARETDTEILDKTGLILNIFSERARTGEAKLQVEYAKLEYMLPRLAGMRENLSRQGGTGGSMSNKGSGEKQIELDRRHIEKRMTELRRDLKEVEKNRQTQRKKRQTTGMPLAALVGYTNAGKSTLLNGMISLHGGEEEKKVLAKDMLFATLDTTIRRISPKDKREFLLSDTVGFISDLPHDLVRAFHSTLEEAKLADLILEVIDVSDENYRLHMQVTEETLKELGAGHIPVIYVMNKADQVFSEESLPKIIGDRIYLSAKNGTGMDELLDLIEKAIYPDDRRCCFLIPYQEGAYVNYLKQNAVIHKLNYEVDGTYIEADCAPMVYGKCREFLLNQ